MSEAQPTPPLSARVDRERRGWAPRWWVVFLTGLVLWIAAIVVTRITRNLNMIPTVVLLGSFLVPVSAVIWYLDHDPSPFLGPRRIFDAFALGGIIGVLAVSLVEFWLLAMGLLGTLAVGLSEEGVKAIALAVLAWHLPAYSRRDGIVLGATVGFGFAALESSGYAFTSLLVVHGPLVALSLNSLIYTELIRSVLAPFGHGLWTAIMGGVLFGAARNGHLRLTWAVVLTYLGVSILHATYDTLANIPGYAVVSVIGVAWLVYLWRRGRPGLVATAYGPGIG
jgi:RsiW-degrading membrane proteinase PrsW (M82 family)